MFRVRITRLIWYIAPSTIERNAKGLGSEAETGAESCWNFNYIYIKIHIHIY